MIIVQRVLYILNNVIRLCLLQQQQKTKDMYNIFNGKFKTYDIM